MSGGQDDAWEYERPEYATAEAVAEALPTPRPGDEKPADVAGALPAQRGDGADHQATPHTAERITPDAATPPADLAEPGAALGAESAAAAPATAGLAEPAAPEAGSEPSLPVDDATWQLSTDMAPLPPLRQCLEAILLVVDEPVAEVVLAQITERPRDEVAAVLQELSAEYTEQQRGFDLRQVAGGWRFYTRAACAPLVEKFVLDGQQARLSTPALETLAVVAYRQPVSRSRISAVRGVNCDGVMRTLLTRGLVEEAGSDAESGAILYRTTPYFLERMGMQSLDELPELAPLLPSIESMEEAESVA